MPYLTSLALDRANEWLVRLRLGSRLRGDVDRSGLTHLGELGDRVHPEPRTLGRFAPQPVADTSRLWRCPSPWPEAGGNNATWYAEVVGARGGGPDAARPALILLHGWLASRPHLIVYRRWARKVACSGIDVWMPRLPHHMERVAAGEISGERSLSPQLGSSIDAVRQAVAEARLLARWLRREGAPAVGIWGMSLGGWVAALAATLDDHWDAAALWAPVASPVDVLFESRLVGPLRSAVVGSGLSEEDFAAPEIAWMTPAARAAMVPRERVLVVAGAYDRVISPRSVARIARRWNVDVRWVPHGHISLMASGAPLRDTVTFLASFLLGPKARRRDGAPRESCTIA